jgi:hypothetical protein
MIYDINNMDNLENGINQKNKNRLKTLNYENERKVVLASILEIIGINNDNKIFYSHILDFNKDIQEKLLALDDEIERVFNVVTWALYKPNTRNNIERRYLSIVKCVLKAMNINFGSVSMKMKYEGNTINTTCYTLN